MIKPNWEIFKAKFSENPQSIFEWLCYLLFCKEFDQPYGIFRYKNQSAIETNPISVDGEVIGWQAKFYETSLSNHNHTDDLIGTLEKAKRDYSDITKVIFYTNQEWGQAKGDKPKGLKDIEKTAKSLGITIDWKGASFFESPFVSVNNESIAKHFFTNEKSIFNLIEEQQKHTDNILNQIHTEICFNGNTIEIDRNKQLVRLLDRTHPILILSGIAGVGKTALIKNLYIQLQDEMPFLVFKATEFELRHINDLFVDFSFSDFANAIKSEENKIIVIDSAEKLLDLQNSEPFKEFLSVLVDQKWKIIFTTRDNYLEDLNYQFFEIYNIAPLNISLRNLGMKELSTISEEYLFSLPEDEKLLELIRNPFYLNEYLQFYDDKEKLDYCEFKNKLWKKSIRKSHSERERCFLQIALDRANTGQFFINPSCDPNTLDNELVRDGILGYENAGYFITHDIYEEWALEKIIESEFIKKSSSHGFFVKLGAALPIRRAFRNWLSEKLFLRDADITVFIEEVIGSGEIESFWKDEILISVLLSDYSNIFFDFIKEELLSSEQELLKKLTFLLRIACKEVDNDFFKQLGMKNLNLLSLTYILTKPKGQGWKSLIQFVFENIEIIGINNINFILPVIHDWNSKVKEGETTRCSSLIALQYYQWSIEEDIYFSNDNTQEHLLQTLLYGASEIKNELKEIFENILRNKWKNHRDPYYDLVKVILTKLEGIPVCKVLPEYVLKLANLFWTYSKKESAFSYYSPIDIEQYFGLESTHSDYFPASAYQTPIYWLFQFSFKETIDFILDFMNKSVQSYVKSGFDKSVKEVTIFLDDENKKKQYVSHCLWNIYRGTSSPVSPNLLQSIHMALEKFFLEIGDSVETHILENWLIYLLKNSNSASISAVVTSIVLAYPQKTFNVAKVLFQTKEFIIQDKARIVSDQHAESLYSIGRNMGIEGKNDLLYVDERLKTCADKHRKSTLEFLFLYYQCFGNEGISDSDVEKRQNVLWEILDNYYKELPSEPEQSDLDKTWRLFLARMDRRNMNISSETTDRGIEIEFNPELEPALKEYSEKSLAESVEPFKYCSLKVWAEYKFNSDNKCKQYEKYENDPKHALNEVKDILEKLTEISASNSLEMGDSKNEDFFRFSHSIPASVCSVVLRDYGEELTDKEKSFCRDNILEVSSFPLQSNYRYQVLDGVQQSIAVLPTVIQLFPEYKDSIKIILLLNLFNRFPIGGMFSNENFTIFPIMAIQQLWETHFDDAQSLLLGYLLLKSKYDELDKRIREENYKKGIYEYQDDQLLTRFCDDNEEELQNMVNNKLVLSNPENITENDLFSLGIAFKIIQQKTDNPLQKVIAQIIISTFANKLMSDDKEDKIDYQVKRDFLKTYAYYVLNSPQEEITNYLLPFLENFNSSKIFADLFQEFILAEDNLQTYDKFWVVWNSFKENVFNICKNGERYLYVSKIIKSYLFAQIRGKEKVKEWYSLNDKNKKFLKEVSEKIGHCPSTLYAFSKLLNDIGSNYIDEGIVWVAKILWKNEDLANMKLEFNTIYYLENLVRKYIFNNRQKIKKTKSIKGNLLIILDFLIEKGSVVGYMLRERIL